MWGVGQWATTSSDISVLSLHPMDQMGEGQIMCCGVVKPSLVTELWTAHNADIAARCWSSCVVYSVQLATFPLRSASYSAYGQKI